MAAQLQNEGEEVELLVMLDSYPGHFLPNTEAPTEEEALIALLALGGYDPITWMVNHLQWKVQLKSFVKMEVH